MAATAVTAGTTATTGPERNGVGNRVVPEALEVPPDLGDLRCGTTYLYWSSSCGPISTSRSRHCSHGGHPVNPHACTTHFSEGSRSCGLASLGCKPLCRFDMPACDHGVLSFVSSARTVGRDVSEVLVPVQRASGSDGNVAVDVGPCPGEDHGGGIQTQTLAWSHGDESPKQYRVVLPPLERDSSVRLCLCLQAATGGAMIGSVSRHSVTHSAQTPGGSVIYLRAAEYSVGEQDGHIDVIVARSRADQGQSDEGQQAKLSVGPASAGLEHIGGTATAHVDFQPPYNAIVHWGPGDFADKHVRVPIYDDDDPEGDEYFVLTLTDLQGGSAEEGIVQIDHVMNQLATVRIIDDDVGVTDATQQSSVVRSLLNLEVGNRADDDFFVRRWRPVALRAHTTIFRQGDPAESVYVIERGQILLAMNGSDVFNWGQMKRDGAKGAIYKRGDIFGLFEVKYGYRRPTSAHAVTDVKMWVCAARDVLKYGLADDAIRIAMEREFIRDLVKRLDVGRPPVFLFPGFMSTRLVAWQQKWCRGLPIDIMDHVWFSMEKLMQTLISDPTCWLDCLALGANQTDPADCRVRAMDGLEAITELEPGLFTSGVTTIYKSLIRHLVTELNYDASNIVSMPYDWRLSPSTAEARDGYYSAIKSTIEHVVSLQGSPAVAIGHSMGCLVVLHFCEWLKHTMGNEAQPWINRHIRIYYGLAAPLLGSLDSVEALAVGNTMGLPISAAQAKNMAMTFGSIPWFLPSSGNAGPPRSPRPGWNGTIVHLRDAHGVDREYNVSDIQSGRWFAEMAALFNDSRFAHVKYYHDTQYRALPFPNTGTGYPRPPIRHVRMIHGVDLPTPVAVHLEQRGDSREPLVRHTVVEDRDGVFRYKDSGAICGGHNQSHSGDQTVPYGSLSWAQTWHHDQAAVQVTHHEPKLIEYYTNPIGRWGERNVFQIMNRYDPGYTEYYSEYDDDEARRWSVNVIEIDGISHRDVVKHDFTLKILVDSFTDLVHRDLKRSMKAYFHKGPTGASPPRTQSARGHDEL